MDGHPATQRMLVLLDVDSVVNPTVTRGASGDPAIKVRPDVVALVGNLAGAAEVQWTTTWSREPLPLLTAAVGLPPPRAVPFAAAMPGAVTPKLVGVVR